MNDHDHDKYALYLLALLMAVNTAVLLMVALHH